MYHQACPYGRGLAVVTICLPHGVFSGARFNRGLGGVGTSKGWGVVWWG